MTREEQIRDATLYYEPGDMRDSFIEGAQWADRTMLEEVLLWLEDATINDADGCGHPIVSFTCCDNKEEMFQSFKERFNIE